MQTLRRPTVIKSRRVAKLGGGVNEDAVRHQLDHPDDDHQRPHTSQLNRTHRRATRVDHRTSELHAGTVTRV